MKNRAKIMQQAERTLKRSSLYLENRSNSNDPEDNYQLDYVLVKDGEAVPDNAFAYAHYEDRIVSFYPFDFNVCPPSFWDMAFSFDIDLFSFLEKGYELAGMSLTAHCEAWQEITDYHICDGLDHPRGMQRYLRYCKQNGITVDLLRKDHQYDGMDVLTLYNQSGL